MKVPKDIRQPRSGKCWAVVITRLYHLGLHEKLEQKKSAGRSITIKRM
jgi:hypothetical protein